MSSEEQEAAEPTRPAAAAAGPSLERLAWALALPAALLWVAVVHFAGPWFAPDPNALHITFFPNIPRAPEPVEQTRYEIAALGPLFVLGVVLGARRLLAGRTGGPALLVGAVVAQLALVAVVVGSWANLDRSAGYFPTWYPPFAAVACALAVALLAARPAWRMPTRRGRWVAPACWAVGVVVTAIGLSVTIFREGNIAATWPQTNVHMLFTMEEFFSAAYGRSPMADFTAQYTNVLPYLGIIPLRISSSVFTFTCLMAMLSGAAFMSIMAAFRRLTGSWGVALALYVPVLALALWPALRSGAQIHTVANYYAVMPLRYVGPLVTLWLLARVLDAPTRRRLLVLGFVAGLTLVNNFEFGVPAVAGVFVALAAARRPDAPFAWRATVRFLVPVAGMIVVAAALFAVVTLVRSGQLPDVGRYTSFSREYALAGVSMSPITRLFDAPLVAFATFAAATIWGLVRGFAGAAAPDARGRVGTGLLVYTGIFGLGAMMYWVGRSLPANFIAIFCAWALVTAVLAWEVLVVLRDRWSRREVERWLVVVPALLVFFHVGIAVASITADRQLGQQLNRLKDDKQPQIYSQATLAHLLRDCSAHGENVLVASILGYRTAGAAGLNNWFPLNEPDQIVSDNDITLVLDAIEDHHVRTVYLGRVAPELAQALTKAGWKTVASRPNADPAWPGVDTSVPFTVWRRATDTKVPTACGPKPVAAK